MASSFDENKKTYPSQQWLFSVNPRIISIVGPTASGKTSLSLQLAEYLTQWGCPTEIINQDAYHVYKHMSIGTAKPTADELARIQHHLIDILDPSERMTVARFQSLARAAIKDCAHRHVRPLLIGGSGLYSRAAIDDLHFHSENMSIRKYLQERAQKEGINTLFNELKILNPSASDNISIQNERRIIRTLEVLYMQKITSANDISSSISNDTPTDIFMNDNFVQTIENQVISDSEIQDLKYGKFEETIKKEMIPTKAADKESEAHSSNLKTYSYVLPTVQIGLDFDREVLRERICQRTQQMWDMGWVEEVEWLYSHLSITANQALGYREIVQYIRGELTKDETLDLINRKTYRLAKKQMGWFGRDPRIHWLNGQSENVLEEAIDIVQRADRGEFDARDYGEHTATQWHLGDIAKRQSSANQ